MGSKKKGILDRIKEGEEVGGEAIDYGETLEGDGKEIKALLDSIDTSIDEDDLRAVKTAEAGYDSAFQNEFKERVDPNERKAENIEKNSIEESSQERVKVSDAARRFQEAARITDVGRQNAEDGSDAMTDSVREYESYISEAEKITRKTREEVESLRTSIDGIFG